jgi:hypothetical protein
MSQMSEMSEKEAFPYMSIRHFVEICNPLPPKSRKSQP